jgi:hypothetical protein
VIFYKYQSLGVVHSTPLTALELNDSAMEQSSISFIDLSAHERY